MRVIMKIEKREIKFSCGVIAWIFLLIFYFSKIERKWLAKDSFSAKNQKDVIWRYVPWKLKSKLPAKNILNDLDDEAKKKKEFFASNSVPDAMNIC